MTDNPLTARVIVNRVWQGHFGYGLVRTPGDFGTAGEKPTHPELLDWLADRLVADGWSLKKLQTDWSRSNTYRMSKRLPGRITRPPIPTRPSPLARPLSSGWKQAEAIHGAMLAVSGRLNPRPGRRAFTPTSPREAIEANSGPSHRLEALSRARGRPAHESTSSSKRSLLVPLVEALDLCDTAPASTARRDRDDRRAPQALTLYNGAFANRMASAHRGRSPENGGPGC